MKLQNVKRPIVLFFRTCLLFPLFYGAISVPLVMLASVTGLLGSKHGTQIAIYFAYFFAKKRQLCTKLSLSVIKAIFYGVLPDATSW